MSGRVTDKVIVVVYTGKSIGRKYWLVTSTAEQGKWTLIKGSEEKGQSSLKTAGEEALEEAGIVVGKLTRLGQEFKSPDGKRVRVFYGRAKKILPEKKWVESSQRKRVRTTYPVAMWRLRRKGTRWSKVMLEILKAVHTS